MIRQLGLPTWFGSFSSADTKWIDLLRILGKLVKIIPMLTLKLWIGRRKRVLFKKTLLHVPDFFTTVFSSLSKLS